jgi:hypothetical protein
LESDILEKQPVYIDKNGNEHPIYPMVLGDYRKVERWFSKINREYLYFNLPTPKLDKKNNVILDKKTKQPIMDYTAYNSMMSLFELALRESKEEIEKWVDLNNGVHILDEYTQLSGLKKKIQENMQNQILTTLLQA